MIEELQEAVSLFGRGEDGDFSVECLDSVVPLSSDEASIVGRRSDQAECGRTVGGGGCSEREFGAICEDHLGKADDGDVVGSEVAVDTGVDTLRVIGAQLRDITGDDGVCRKDEGVVRVDRVDKLRTDRLADTHGKVMLDSDRERCANRESGFRCLRLSGECRKKKTRKKSAPCSSEVHLT